MGSATVDIPERWRPWLNSGVTHILGPLPWVDEFHRESAKNCIEEGPTGAWAKSPDISPPQEQIQKKQQDKTLFSSEKTPEFHKSPARHGKNAAAPPDKANGDAGPVSQRPMPMSNWPAAWQNAWSKTAFARPFLWTYAELGDDLLGTPAPERREALKKILGTLGLGPVHNFWPFSEPDGQGGLRLQAKFFREGLTYLAPKCVIFLGREKTSEITGPDMPELFKVISYLDAGVLCVHLPDILKLASHLDLLEKMMALFQEKLIHLI